jgi:sortase A
MWHVSSSPPDDHGRTGTVGDEPAGNEGAARPDADQRRGRSRRPSALTVVGIVLLVAGLACLGWVGYQYLGTNVVSEKVFHDERDALRARWTQQQQSDPKGKLMDSVVPGQAMALLRIPALGSSYEVPILNGTTLPVLAKGVGHYASTAQPGQIGNFAVAGHRVTHGQPFNRLLDLKQGDKIIVETRQEIYTYVLDESPKQLTVKETDTWVIDPVPGKPDAKPTQALITLTTCQDLFHSPDRSIGFGHLESTQNK